MAPITCQTFYLLVDSITAFQRSVFPRLTYWINLLHEHDERWLPWQTLHDLQSIRSLQRPPNRTSCTAWLLTMRGNLEAGKEQLQTLQRLNTLRYSSIPQGFRTPDCGYRGYLRMRSLPFSGLLLLICVFSQQVK